MPQVPNESFVTNMRIYVFVLIFVKSVNYQMKDADLIDFFLRFRMKRRKASPILAHSGQFFQEIGKGLQLGAQPWPQYWEDGH